MSMALGAWVDTVACDSPVMHEGNMETGKLGHEGHSLGAESTKHPEGPEYTGESRQQNAIEGISCRG